MDVDRLNSQELAKLRGEEVVYEASAWGKEPFLKALQRGCTGAQGDAWPRCLLWRCLLTTFWCCPCSSKEAAVEGWSPGTILACLLVSKCEPAFVTCACLLRQVILLRNLRGNDRTDRSIQLCNGSRGQVIGFAKDEEEEDAEVVPVVEFETAGTA